MNDDYLKKDRDGIIILDGRRRGGDRRKRFDRREFPFDMYGIHDKRQHRARRDARERRIGPVYSRADLFLEHLSDFILGCFLMLAGVFMVISGLTFMPVIGLFAGVVVLFIGSMFCFQAFRSTWPSV